MRFHVGAVPETDFAPDGSWTPLREPGPVVMQLFANPPGIAAALAVGSGWRHLLRDVSLTLSRDTLLFVPFILLAALIAIIPVHEFVHALFHPHFGRTDESVVGAGRDGSCSMPATPAPTRATASSRSCPPLCSS